MRLPGKGAGQAREHVKRKRMIVLESFGLRGEGNHGQKGKRKGRGQSNPKKKKKTRMEGRSHRPSGASENSTFSQCS